MTKFFAAIAITFALACGAANTPVESASTFAPSGLRMVIGVDRAKTFTVSANGEVTSSETGNVAMKFDGSKLDLADGSKTLLSLDGSQVNAGGKPVATIDQEGLMVGGMHIVLRDDGAVELDQDGTHHKMRMHFEGAVVGKKRPALMLVALVFALYAAANPHATLDRFYDD